MAEEYVITPGGYRPKSQVHPVESGHILDGTGGNIRVLDQASKLVADYGQVLVKPGERPLMPLNVTAVNPSLLQPELTQPSGAAAAPKRVPGLGSGWITFAFWNNNTGKPITSFKTTWKVPPTPPTQNGQTIFLFNGIQNSTNIFQPVLQWGVSAAGGGNYWAVASWYADGQTGHSFYSRLTQVAVGQELVGIMTQTGDANGLFSYECQFQGIGGSSLPAQNIQQLTSCAETLECYGMTTASDYPATAETQMTAIEIKTTAGHPTLSWIADDAVTDCGQHTVVVSNKSPDGEVDLFYKPDVKAAAGGPLTCLFAGDGGPRVYYLGAKDIINELAAAGSGWVDNASIVAPKAGSSLTCLYIGDVGSRVYYQTGGDEIREVTWPGEGSEPPPTGAVAKAGSPLTCLYIGNVGSRIYYLDHGNNVKELALDGGHPAVSGILNSVPVASNSSLTCLQAGGGGTRVYYLDQNNQVREVALIGGNPTTSGPLNQSAPAAAGSALTCLYISDVGSRIYYLDQQHNIREVALDGGVPNVSGPLTQSAPAASGSALTCLLAGGGGTRVYYLDQQHNVRELALIGGAPIVSGPLHPSAPATPSSPLTCLYISDVGSRVYYVDTQRYIRELAWNGGQWTATIP